MKGPKMEPKLRYTKNDRRLRELILYISDLSEGDQPFGSVKLNKLLFFADFEAYLQLGESITGQEYQSLDYGPAPKRMFPIMNTMQQDGDLFLRATLYQGKPQKRPISQRDPRLKGFTAEQIDLVNRIVERYRGMTAERISEISHDFIGCQLAIKGVARIPYEVTLVGKRPPTEKEREWGAALEPMAQQILANRGV
jgi:hypothetical protein